MELQSDPMETASIRLLSQTCRTVLERLFREEEAQEEVQANKDGHWASRQFSEFNIWCAKVGINDRGLRSVDVRLKDVPETCQMIRGLLQSLDQDLKQIQEPVRNFLDDTAKQEELSNSDSDSSSLSFESLSSVSQTEAETAINEGSIAEKQMRALQGHIEDTIDRLHGHALQIDRAGNKHRQERLAVYMRKENSRAAYDGYMDLAYRKAKIQFHDTTDILHKRMGESFARRRIRFDYLKKHQRKRAKEAIGIEQTVATRSSSSAQQRDSKNPQLQPTDDLEAPLITHATARPLNDSQTECSATEHTKLDTGPNMIQQRQRTENFEPYFCIFEDCQAPFDVPNDFNGLLMHLQEHMEERFYVDLPSGGHEAFDVQGIKEHFERHVNCSSENLDLIKEASHRRGALILENCPFCGGYPDDIRKKYPVSTTNEAQMALRKHIKRHMHDIALFLPPYRDDISNKSNASAAASDISCVEAPTGSQRDFEDNVTICDRTECDCKLRAGRGDFDEVSNPPPPKDSENNPETADFWFQYFPDLPQYNSGLLTEDDYLQDTKLEKFFAARLRKDPGSTGENRIAIQKNTASDSMIERTVTDYGLSDQLKVSSKVSIASNADSGQAQPVKPERKVQTVPRRQAPNFTGREKELAHVHSILHPEDSSQKRVDMTIGCGSLLRRQHV
ncbi:hypothetical protein CKAH01_13783 [Colletotrichum kahawae]|uniref:C2H2-type domain-containing protein n=1 Tax=Colletotrichum kahawae TaxID=34407 RepID=A0AAE0DDJ2_COLKA|nr:hypothetical protein CKAH01_13783 [Colletotrichum kahawae]